MNVIKLEINEKNVVDIYEEITIPLKEKLDGDESILGEEWLDGYLSGFLDLLNLLDVTREEIETLYNNRKIVVKNDE